MCLGVPGMLVERNGGEDVLAEGVVEFAGVRRKVALAFVPEAQPGDYVIVHAGVAIARIDETEARRVFEYLAQIGEADGWTGSP